jgi:hypothetical protein|tara:strand:- start:285 stop:911 length:627 start_codon:yes stop_codon:yes gene_type:complete
MADDHDVQYADDAAAEFLDYEEKKKRLGGTRHLDEIKDRTRWTTTSEEYRPPGVINKPPLTLGKIAAASGIGALTALPIFRGAQGVRALAPNIVPAAVQQAGRLYRHLRGQPIPEPRAPRPEYLVPRSNQTPTQARPKPSARTRKPKQPKNPTEAELQAYREGIITRGELYHRSAFKKGGAVRGMSKSSRKKNIDGKALQGKTKTKYF